jgi:hypothetical protein
MGYHTLLLGLNHVNRNICLHIFRYFYGSFDANEFMKHKADMFYIICSYCAIVFIKLIIGLTL